MDMLALRLWMSCLHCSACVRIICSVTLALGLWLWWGYGIGLGPQSGWMHAKLFLVFLTLGYHHWCMRHLKSFENGDLPHGHVWYRWFNEAPVLLMVAAVLLVVLKPF